MIEKSAKCNPLIVLLSFAIALIGGFYVGLSHASAMYKTRAEVNLNDMLTSMLGRSAQMYGRGTPDSELKNLYRKIDPMLGPLSHYQVLSFERGVGSDEFVAKVRLSWQHGETTEHFIAHGRRRFAYGVTSGANRD